MNNESLFQTTSFTNSSLISTARKQTRPRRTTNHKHNKGIQARQRHKRHTKHEHDMEHAANDDAYNKYSYTASFRRRKYPSSLYHQEEEPFHIVACKIGSTIFILASLSYTILTIRTLLFGNINPNSKISNSQSHHVNPYSVKQIQLKTPPWNQNSTLTNLNISTINPSLFPYDIFGRMETNINIHMNVNVNVNKMDTKIKHHNNKYDTKDQFWTMVHDFSNDFAKQYGGIEAARYLLHHIIHIPETSYPSSSSFSSKYKSSIYHLAQQMLLAKSENRPFRIAFTGYNAVAAKGNIHKQSFTYYFLELLQEIMYHLLGIELEIINMGMANISPFPYGWCLKEFLMENDIRKSLNLDTQKDHIDHDSKTPLDVVMMDVSMSRNVDGVEAFLRNVAVLHGNPIIIWRDIPSMNRNDKVGQLPTHIFKSYIQQNVIPESSIIFNAVSKSMLKPFLDLQPQSRPPGFQFWEKYNTPTIAHTEKSRYNPTAQEHELMAWSLAAHFLTSLELIASKKSKGRGKMLASLQHYSIKHFLPPPLTNMSHYFPLSYGTPLPSSSSSNHWIMRKRYCFTTFNSPTIFAEYSVSNLEGKKSTSFSTLIQSGTIAEDVNVLLPKGPMYYYKGWVLDMTDTDKKRHQQESSLGYVDSKVGYFGVKASGKLSLFLPYHPNSSQILHHPKKEIYAHSLYQSLTICGINEQNRGLGACEMVSDVLFRVGGFISSKVTYLEGDETMYLGKKLCVEVDVPKNAVLTSRTKIDDETSNKSNKQHYVRMQQHEKKQNSNKEENEYGLKLEMEVINPHVTIKSGPCSISHVIWEQ